MIGKYCVVRCEHAGVFAGTLKNRDGRDVTLTDVRRLWKWSGAFTCSQLAVDGTKEPENCFFTITVEEITLLDAIEIIPCTQEAENSIKAVKEWKI